MRCGSAYLWNADVRAIGAAVRCSHFMFVRLCREDELQIKQNFRSLIESKSFQTAFLDAPPSPEILTFAAPCQCVIDTWQIEFSDVCRDTQKQANSNPVMRYRLGWDYLFQPSDQDADCFSIAARRVRNVGRDFARRVGPAPLESGRGDQGRQLAPGDRTGA